MKNPCYSKVTWLFWVTISNSEGHHVWEILGTLWWPWKLVQGIWHVHTANRTYFRPFANTTNCPFIQNFYFQMREYRISNPNLTIVGFRALYIDWRLSLAYSELITKRYLAVLALTLVLVSCSCSYQISNSDPYNKITEEKKCICATTG